MYAGADELKLILPVSRRVAGGQLHGSFHSTAKEALKARGQRVSGQGGVVFGCARDPHRAKEAGDGCKRSLLAVGLTEGKCSSPDQSIIGTSLLLTHANSSQLLTHANSKSVSVPRLGLVVQPQKRASVAND